MTEPDEPMILQEVINMMKEEIIKLRKQLDSRDAQLPNDKDRVAQLEEQLANEKKRVANVENERDGLTRRLAANERALQRALSHPPLSPPHHSHQSSQSSHVVFGNGDWERDHALVIEELRKAGSQRDEALLELRQMRESMRNLELDLSDLEEGLSDDEDEEKQFRAPHIQIVRSLSQELARSRSKNIRENSIISSGSPTRANSGEDNALKSLTNGNDRTEKRSSIKAVEKQQEPLDSPGTVSSVQVNNTYHNLSLDPEQRRQYLLSQLPIPPGYPVEPIQPINLPAKLHLHAFLDQATGSMKQLLTGHQQFLSHEITWCKSRPYHGYVLKPRLVFRPPIASSSVIHSTPILGAAVAGSPRSSSGSIAGASGEGKWVETDGTGGMHARSTEVFYQQNPNKNDWFYIGTFQAYPLADLTVAEVSRLQFSALQGLLRDTVTYQGGLTDPTWTPDHNRWLELYRLGVLKVSCVGIQCVGYNHSLHRVMLEQSRRLQQIRSISAPIRLRDLT